jgi:Ras-related protein Rab-1A
LIRDYYREAQGIVFVYDVTLPESFQNVLSWLEEVREFGEKDVHKLLIGNKSDLSSDRKVSEEEGKVIFVEIVL